MLETLAHAPVIVKVLGSLGAILLFNALTRRLSLSLAFGVLVIGLWLGHPLLGAAKAPGIAGIAWTRLSSTDNLLLLAAVALVIWLSCQMAETGVMNDLVNTVRARVGKRTAMAALPAVIGWLPMPGGAAFSAPLVEQCDGEEAVAPLLKTKTNYWFRHVWEYWWPLYPGVLLAIQITGLEVWQFVLLQLPLSFYAIAAGWLTLLRRIESPPASTDASGQDTKPFLVLIRPILVTIGLYVAIRLGYGGLRQALPFLPALHRYVPMLLGILGAIWTLERMRPLPREKRKAVFASPRTFRLILIVALVRIFGAFIETNLPGGASVVEAMRLELDRWGIPLLAVIVIIPFLSGLSTGLAIGFVGAGLPIALHLLGPNPPQNVYLATILLAYTAGYAGMILSPVHVCFIVTNEHFRTRLVHALLRLIPTVLIVLLLATLHYLFFRTFWPATSG